MREFDFDIDESMTGREIYTVLSRELHCSANIISKMKQGDYIMVNGARQTVRYRLKQGEKLKIIIPTMGRGNVEPNSSITFDVLYEDEDILAVDKPANTPTHPSIHHFCDTLANGVVAYLNDDDFTFRAVNRLDRETSGVVLIAKNMLAAHILSETVKNREIQKEYAAICVGTPSKAVGEITAPIARERESIITRCVRADGSFAKTEYRTVKSNGELTLLEVKPLTGRTHQIRVHFAYIGCPLYGDGLYGEKIEGERTRLHCSKMSFCHPISGKVITVESPLPQDFGIIR